MSVVMDFSIFPMDKGESVGEHVARTVKIIRESGLPYKLGAMGTSVEGEWDELLPLVSRCFKELEKDSKRIYMTIKADYREGASGRLQAKVESVERRL